ncbi:MAG: low molecular weight phosphatase family protein [Planctomyces sp.]|nr:low molecular weight phosphatase family protein [Planctomyces sp.]
MKLVMFLCTGNYYRSRFAEILFNHLMALEYSHISAGDRWVAESRGLKPDERNPGPISVHTVAALERFGIRDESSERFPIAVLTCDFERSQHIVAVKEAEHRSMLESDFPDWLERVEFWHIDDIDCGPPAATIEHLEREVRSLIVRLLDGSGA